jgi:general secretion pathway protein B
MSMLLDALRKSENQKRLGDLPSIHSAGPQLTSGSGRRSPGRLLLILVPVLLILGWFSWKQFAPPPTQEVSDVAPAQLPVLEQRTSEPPPEEESGTTALAPPPESVFTSPVETLPLAQNPGETSPAPDTVSSAAAENRPQATNPFGGPAADTAAERQADPPQPPSTEDAAADDRESLQPISFWQLPEAVRAQVGEIRITVLVYAEQPEDRFILVNGGRMAEGDATAGGLEVAEIRRDGVVFTYQLYRFLVSR